MKNRLTNWHTMRIIRLVSGLFIIWSAVDTHQLFVGLIGGLLLVQAVFNAGCGPLGCAVPSRSKQSTLADRHEAVKDIPYQEVQ